MANNNQNNRDGGSTANKTSAKTNSNKAGERGFAAMDPEEQKRIASEGGKAAHKSGNANEFTSEQAREAGKKSGGNGDAKTGDRSGNDGGGGSKSGTSSKAASGTKTGNGGTGKPRGGTK